MQKISLLILTVFTTLISDGQKIETVYLNAKDSTSDMYIAVSPEDQHIKSILVLLDGFGNSPNDVLFQTDIPRIASQQGILTIIPLLKTGTSYFGSDSASQQSLKEIIELVVNKYELKGKALYIGGFSIGGTCAVKYSELSVQKNYRVKPKAVFAIDPPA